MFVVSFQKCNNDLTALQQELCDIFGVSQVFIQLDDSIQNVAYLLKFDKSNLYHCIRCRKITADKNNELCTRCSYIVKETNKDFIAV